ncbi:hypothetical protein G9A89_009828 [Geosiphon pyriformis]|nr:hypothetical protein G9A89_009828 [Geosiphon pyriformis]
MEVEGASLDISNFFVRFQTQTLKALVEASTESAQIDASDVSFLRKVDRSGRTDLDRVGDRVLNLVNRLLQNSSTPAYGSNRTGLLQEEEDIDNKFDDIVEVLEGAIEKIDVCLDEFTGRAKEFATPVIQSNPVVAKLSTNSESRFLYAQNIIRPQLTFKDKIDNSRALFLPKLKNKPNAQVPLMQHADGTMNIENELSGFPHPYEYEINNLVYPVHMFNQPNGQMYAPFESTTHIFVSKEEELSLMCQKLERAQEIAVDLEHHDYRTYQGFVCLIQISTREEDYIIDAFTLRHTLHALNNIFTNPNIVKVFHGAQSDILWLQRDFGVYVVNLFDTFHASKVLSLPHHSLAFLVKEYCGVYLDKQYQLADWRIRPLPKEMLNYARSDTHYLIYIYDCMKKELLPKSKLMQTALERSRETSLLKYEKQQYDSENGEGPGGWKNTLNKCNRTFNHQQLAVFKAVHEWRDQKAREEDESVRYVLPNNMLFEIAQRMPQQPSEVIGCCNPPPSLIRIHAMDIALLVQRLLKLVDASVKQQVDSLKLSDSSDPTINASSNIDDMDLELDEPALDVSKFLSERSSLFGNELDHATEFDPKASQIMDKILTNLDFSITVPDKAQIMTNSQAVHLYTPQGSRLTKLKENQSNANGNFSETSNPYIFDNRNHEIRDQDDFDAPGDNDNVIKSKSKRESPRVTENLLEEGEINEGSQSIANKEKVSQNETIHDKQQNLKRKRIQPTLVSASIIPSSSKTSTQEFGIVSVVRNQHLENMKQKSKAKNSESEPEEGEIRERVATPILTKKKNKGVNRSTPYVIPERTKLIDVTLSPSEANELPGGTYTRDVNNIPATKKKNKKTRAAKREAKALKLGEQKGDPSTTLGDNNRVDVVNPPFLLNSSSPRNSRPSISTLRHGSPNTLGLVDHTQLPFNLPSLSNNTALNLASNSSANRSKLSYPPIVSRTQSNSNASQPQTGIQSSSSFGVNVSSTSQSHPEFGLSQVQPLRRNQKEPFNPNAQFGVAEISRDSREPSASTTGNRSLTFNNGNNAPSSSSDNIGSSNNPGGKSDRCTVQ